MPEGLTFNCSMVQQPDGFYEVGIRYSDTNNIDIDILATDDDLEDLLEDLTYDFIEEYLIQTTELDQEKENQESDEGIEEDNQIRYLKNIIKDLQKENNSLKTDLEILQRRADDAVYESQKQKDSLAKYLEGWLKSLQ